jgi:hypothetical protein
VPHLPGIDFSDPKSFLMTLTDHPSKLKLHNRIKGEANPPNLVLSDVKINTGIRETVTNNYESRCLQCNRNLRGRSDKKFCDAYCRNAYHNEHKKHVNILHQKINGILKKNRSILERFFKFKNKPCRVKRQMLLKRGFNINFFTHLTTDKRGRVFVFCYEYGYLLAEDTYLIIKQVSPPDSYFN